VIMSVISCSGEDNTLLLWDMQTAQPETLSLPFPTPSTPSSASPSSSPGFLLPVLAQSVSCLVILASYQAILLLVVVHVYEA